MTSKRARRAEAALRADVAVAAQDQHVGAQPKGAERSRTPGRRGIKRSKPDFDAASAAAAVAATGPADFPTRALPSTVSENTPSASTVSASTGSGGAAEADEWDAAYVLPDDAIVRRTKDGWRVGSDELPDLTCAMVLADLLAAENGTADPRLSKPSLELAGAGETGKLRATVGQLEHALLTRIRVEQAIGVLAERHRIKPRQAFEQLRDAARSRGRKVIDIATDVVASATNPLLQLPEELSRPRSGPRRARQSFNAQ
jgi:hypothetical protein